jgi:sulfonate transport system ATP-binding protein
MHPHPGRIVGVLPVPFAYPRDRSAPAFVRLRDEVLSLLGVTRYSAPASLREAASAAA